MSDTETKSQNRAVNKQENNIKVGSGNHNELAFGQSGGGYKLNYLSRENTNCFKGICAVIIVLSHLYNRTNTINCYFLSVIFQTVAYLMVSAYFFFSGYGLIARYEKDKDQYMSSFIRNRFVPMYCDNVLLILVYTFLKAVLDEELTLSEFIQSFFFGGTVVEFGWYLQMILLLYLFFWVVFKTQARTMLIKINSMCLCVALMYIILFILDFPSTWYEGIIAFPMGMFWYINRNKLDTMLEKHYIVLISSFVILFLGSFLAYHEITVFSLSIICKSCSALMFVAIAISIMKKVNLQCGFTKLLGVYYYEIYVVQGFSMLLLHSRFVYINNDVLYIIICLLLTGVLAVTFHPVFQFSKKILRSKQ